MTSVPTIDLRNIDDAALSAIDTACRDHGFFLLTGHGLDELMQDMWTQTEAFFAASSAVKHSVMRTVDNPMGYYDRELTKRKRDQKETFDFRIIDWATGPRAMLWPAEPAGFEDALRRFFTACTTLSETTLHLICRAMGAPEDALDHAFGDRHTSTARLNHYPVEDPVSADEREALTPLGDLALGHHTDPGAITLLMQDSIGGLQTLSTEDGWIDVPPDTGSIVVNMGDSMQVWTNDRYKASVHRVTKRAPGKARYSIPYFYQPLADTMIKPLATGEPPRYQAFSWREFIQGRVDDNFTDLGDDDIQIERYRLAS